MLLLFISITLIKSIHRKIQPLWVVSVGIVIALIFSVLLWVIFSRLNPEDQIPYTSILWALPLGFSLYLVGISIRSIKRLVVSILAALCATVLLLLCANNYYHYYPTLDAVFQTDKAIQPTNNSAEQQAPVSSTLVLEKYYQALPGQSSHGQLLPLDIPSSNPSFSPRTGRIYLPPALSGNDQIKLPVIILLAGHPGSPIHWEQSGLLSIMDTFATAHKGLAPIIAVVDYTGVKDIDTECVDSKQGSAETYLVKDVPAYLKQHYQVQTDASFWAIGGYSSGGTCGPLVALRNPTVYQNFLNISGDAMPSVGSDINTVATLFGNSKQQQLDHTPDYLLKNGNPLYKKFHGWYFYGKQDNVALIQRMQTQYNLAKQVGLTVEIRGIDGHHDFKVWREGFVQGLPWISNQMKLTTYDQK